MDISTRLSPRNVLHALTTSSPVRLDSLPREHGIYALHDHTGAIRYVGITANDKFGFNGRINSRHVSGSEERSHKFSHAYNTGRMWRDKKDQSPDAKAAKALRSAFIRRHCKATFVVVPKVFHAQLPALELAVQDLAPSGMLDWGSTRTFVALPEPRDLVDVILNELSFSTEQRAAVDRQAALRAACAPLIG